MAGKVVQLAGLCPIPTWVWPDDLHGLLARPGRTPVQGGPSLRRVGIRPLFSLRAVADVADGNERARPALLGSRGHSDGDESWTDPTTGNGVPAAQAAELAPHDAGFVPLIDIAGESATKPRIDSVHRAARLLAAQGWIVLRHERVLAEHCVKTQTWLLSLGPSPASVCEMLVTSNLAYVPPARSIPAVPVAAPPPGWSP